VFHLLAFHLLVFHLHVPVLDCCSFLEYID
jgi:hypothetical protein